MSTIKKKEIKLPCFDPHKFLISLIYSLSYAPIGASRRGHPGSLLELGYIFTSIDIPAFFNIPGPDLLLVNKIKKIVLAIDCKGSVDTGNIDGATKRIIEKFSKKSEEYIRLLLNDTTKDYIIENVIYTNLKIFDYNVYVGSFGNKEIDFICEKNGKKLYIQAAYLIPDENVKKREFGNLLKIKDNYRKIVVSMDEYAPENVKGIEHIHLIDFLTNISKF